MVFFELSIRGKIIRSFFKDFVLEMRNEFEQSVQSIRRALLVHVAIGPSESFQDKMCLKIESERISFLKTRMLFFGAASDQCPPETDGPFYICERNTEKYLREIQTTEKYIKVFLILDRRFLCCFCPPLLMLLLLLEKKHTNREKKTHKQPLFGQ